MNLSVNKSSENQAYNSQINSTSESREVSNVANRVLTNASTNPADSSYRRVFKGDEKIQADFKAFLRTIFYQLDEDKVFLMMEGILKDPDKSDEVIYKELVAKVQTALKPLSLISKLQALFTVRTGMGKQAAEHLKAFDAKMFSDYLEVFTRRYVNSVEKEAALSFKNKVAACDQLAVSVLDRVEVGSVFYPYHKSVSLNDSDCENPTLEVEKTYKDLTPEIHSKTLDLTACLGGLHHTPEDRLESFVGSIKETLRPGGVLLVRDHLADDENIKHIATVVHSFVNAVDGLSWEAESREIRNFQGEQYWTSLMERNGFQRIDKQALILPEDPTKNAMMAFVKKPESEDDVEKAACYRKGHVRSKNGSYATWIEWGNVRFAKQYAEYIQDHHAYGFDYIGHIKQHWTHFYHYVKESLNANCDKKDLLFTDNAAMNIFILLGTTVLLGASALAALPSRVVAYLKYGKDYREVVNLSALEKFEAEFQKDYCEFIDYEPFFKYRYFATIKEMWQKVLQADQSFFTKASDIVGAVGFTVSLGVQGLFSTFIDSFVYSQDQTSDVETIDLLIDDPNNEIEGVITRWNAYRETFTSQNIGKGTLIEGSNIGTFHPFKRSEMKVLESFGDRKVVSIPFYKPLMEISKYFTDTGIQLLKVGGHDKITLDVILNKEDQAPASDGNARLIYEMNKLQDQQERHYATYEVSCDKLMEFQKDKEIPYIHVHR